MPDSKGTSRQTSPGQDDPLAPLTVIDRLEVGPVRLERDRLVMPYTVVQGKRVETTELVYRYPEPVFDPADPVARNLASMIGSQAALNYGLFCGEIRFHGPFDGEDRRFLRRFAENTAREIYVNKFLKPNPFLTGPAARLPALRRKRYCRARLTFPDHPAGTAQVHPWSGGTDPSRHAVLSSGGKDSLLSFGLLSELGLYTDAIFINESGRHWYTALNAYRHFAATFPGTARVWTNSDRLFAWMLRRLPFIRPDFARLRADIYPVRLWTVAVFLFGALPLMRKRRIGRLLIGDEFDTTVKGSHEGIPHFEGLYDQSLWFDQEMTGFFQAKGWGVCQFSALRPLSELLIEKVLLERYPALQGQQLSCHAAHVEGSRVRPCGHCEKCRRIVAMLTALGGDPTRCGYGADQVEAVLRDVTRAGLHQEQEDVEHLLYLLQQRGALPMGLPDGVAPRARPEVMRLRFDPVRSPVHAVPEDLQPRLLALLLEHAEGAVERRGRRWVTCDPLGPETSGVAYSQGEATPAAPTEPTYGGAAPHLLGELSWPQAEARFREVDVVLLPVGSIEQHGPHLPLDTDAFDADLLARRVAAACAHPRPLVLPLIPYGVAYHHQDFAGTLSVSPETLSRFVYEIGLSAARHGVRKLVIVNGHGGNGAALHLAAQLINRDTNIFTCVDTGETSDAEIAEIVETPNDVHAGEIETSTSLAVRPELVQMELAPKMVPSFSSRFLDFSHKSAVGWYARTERISASGVMGDPTVATREKGERIWEVMVSRLVELVEDLKRLSLEEIHQRRY